MRAGALQGFSIFGFSGAKISGLYVSRVHIDGLDCWVVIRFEARALGLFFMFLSFFIRKAYGIVVFHR